MKIEDYAKIERLLEIGDTVIVIRTNKPQHVGRIAVVCEKDSEAIGITGLFVIRFRLESGYEDWGRVVPATGLMKELL